MLQDTAVGSTPAYRTEERPLTPPMRAVLAREARRLRMMLYVVAGAVVVLMVALGAYVAAGSPATAAQVVLASGGAGVLAAALALGIGELLLVRRMRRDFSEPVYLSTTGPVRVVKETRGAGGEAERSVDVLHLADCRFDTSRAVAKAVSPLEWATVDHSKRAHFVFSIRDREGRLVYTAKGYQPADGGRP